MSIAGSHLDEGEIEALEARLASVNGLLEQQVSCLATIRGNVGAREGEKTVQAVSRALEALEARLAAWRRLALAYKAIADDAEEQRRRPSMPDRGSVERAERREAELSTALEEARALEPETLPRPR